MIECVDSVGDAPNCELKHFFQDTKPSVVWQSLNLLVSTNWRPDRRGGSVGC